MKLSRTAEDLTGSMGMEEGQDKSGERKKRKESPGRN